MSPFLVAPRCRMPRLGNSVLRTMSCMAKKITEYLVDDLDGTVLEPGRGVTVRFAIDNATYEIDLADHHASDLREALEPYVQAGRRVTSRSTSRRDR